LAAKEAKAAKELAQLRHESLNLLHEKGVERPTKRTDEPRPVPAKQKKKKKIQTIAGSSSSSTTSFPPQMCVALTIKGMPCAKRAVTSSKYCQRHQTKGMSHSSSDDDNELASRIKGLGVRQTPSWKK